MKLSHSTLCLRKRVLNKASPRFLWNPPKTDLLWTARRRLSTTPRDHAQNSAYEFYARRNQPSWFTRTFLQKKNRTKQVILSDQQRNINTAWYMLAVAVGALGASYAAVPLYKVFCQTTGFGGTTQRVSIKNGTSTVSVEDYLQRGLSALLPEGTSARIHTWTDEDATERLRELKPVKDAELITIRFDTTVTDVMPWTFEPVQLDVKVVPGETALSFFRVTNHSDKAITGVATYNVHPAKVGLYFQKIQCFCFEEQRLLPGEVTI